MHIRLPLASVVPCRMSFPNRATIVPESYCTSNPKLCSINLDPEYGPIVVRKSNQAPWELLSRCNGVVQLLMRPYPENGDVHNFSISRTASPSLTSDGSLTIFMKAARPVRYSCGCTIERRAPIKANDSADSASQVCVVGLHFPGFRVAEISSEKSLVC